MKFQSRKAQKRQLALKILCSGSSGSGKTKSALRLATGIVGKTGGSIYLINTEGDRGEMYANEFDYQIIDLPEPRSPENYIEAIKYCMNEGASVIIIDSLSHEWNYLNEQVNNMQGNSFNNWGRQKPRHRKLVDFIVEAKVHIIATGRGKDEYVMEVNDKGKSTPKKIGVGIQQEKDTEYEYMVTFNIAQDTHVATCMKDNTGLFNNKFDVLTEKDGEALYDWANSGVEAPFNISKAQQDIINLATELGGSKDPDVTKATIDILGEANPKNCTDEVLLKQSLAALNSLKVSRGGSK
ncbi:MAG: ATP-binding protein [Tenericutes bacterium]|nr:ATP-binding protein [Mycoplasmatota bacterium]